jgi:hypothetical protein
MNDRNLRNRVIEIKEESPKMGEINYVFQTAGKISSLRVL